MAIQDPLVFKAQAPGTGDARFRFHLFNVAMRYGLTVRQRHEFSLELRYEIPQVIAEACTLDNGRQTCTDDDWNYRYTYEPKINRPYTQVYKQVGLGYGLRVFDRPRTRIQAGVSFGAMPFANRMVSYTILEGASSTDPSSAFVMRVYHGFSYYPLFGLRLELQRQLKSTDILSISLEGRRSTNDFNEGYAVFTQADGQKITVWASEPYLAVGVRVSYSFTWGAPRIPRWMRRSSAKG